MTNQENSLNMLCREFSLLGCTPYSAAIGAFSEILLSFFLSKKSNKTL
jgi:hypothetical protein